LFLQIFQKALKIETSQSRWSTNQCSGNLWRHIPYKEGKYMFVFYLKLKKSERLILKKNEFWTPVWSKVRKRLSDSQIILNDQHAKPGLALFDVEVVC
jgi:hypothetical protein